MASRKRPARTEVEKDAYIERLETMYVELHGHMEYCGWGDSWERECAEEMIPRHTQLIEEIGAG